MIMVLAILLTSAFACFTPNVSAGNISPCANEFYPSAKQHFRLDVRHIEGGGIGYKKGYTTFEGFFATNPSWSSLVPFLDLRGHVFNNGKFASNLGVGLRKSNSCHVFGLNAYYDYRKTTQINFNQIGFGAELLGVKWDLRINGYFPVGKKTVKLAEPSFVEFVGNQMMILPNNQFDMKGFNAEFGWHIDRPNCFDFYLAAGPYYFTQTNNPKVWGGKARLACRYKDYVTLELSNSYDNYFHNKFQCLLTLSLPLGSEPTLKPSDYKNCAEPKAIRSRMVQPVERQEIIVQGNKSQSTAAINPATGVPYFLVFVDNTSHSLGTYESPYPTLAQAQATSKPNDVIYVFPGNGTTTGMDNGITLQNNQKFWGSGTSNTTSTPQGLVTIPAQSDTMPNITNVALDGNAINLAAVNEVSGFNISDVGGYGIFGTELQAITISDCTINNSLNDQIHLEYSGTSSNTNLTNLTLSNGQSNGIYISSSASNDLCNIQSCTLTNTTVYTINSTFNGNAIFNLTQSTFTDNVNGTNLNFNGPASLTITGNSFSNTTSSSETPILIVSQDEAFTANVSNNTITNNTRGALHFVLNDNSQAKIAISNNQINYNNTGAVGPSFGSAILINKNNTANGTCELTLTNNNFTGNTSNSLYCTDGSYDNFNLTANNNALTNNGGGGFVFFNSATTFTLNAENNLIENGNDNGIATVGGLLINTANLNISNNQINNMGNQSNGIAITHTGNNLNLAVKNNTITNNDGSGLLLYPSTAINTVTIDIDSNTISDNQNSSSNASGGLNIEQYVNLTGSITNNTLAGNAETYPDLFVGSAESSPSVCLTMSGNNSETGYYLSNDTGTFNLAPCNIASVNTGAINTIGGISYVESCPEGDTCPI